MNSYLFLKMEDNVLWGHHFVDTYTTLLGGVRTSRLHQNSRHGPFHMFQSALNVVRLWCGRQRGSKIANNLLILHYGGTDPLKVHNFDPSIEALLGGVRNSRLDQSVANVSFYIPE